MDDTANTDSSRSLATRKAIRGFVVAMVALQVLLPLRYYVGLTAGDDERFSWRMFSTVRLQKCDVQVSEARDGSDVLRPVSLRPILQAAWIAVLQRFRPTVVDGLLEFRCKTDGVTQHVTKVRYERRCVAPDGTALSPNRLEIDCASGVISEVRE